MKAEAEQHQLRTTAAGEPDGAQRERGETLCKKRGRDGENPHCRMEELKKIIRTKHRGWQTGRDGETDGGKKGMEISVHLDS